MIVKTNLHAGQDLSAINPNQALSLGASLLQTYAGDVDQQALMELAGQVDQQQLIGLAQSLAANPSAALSLFTP